MTNHDHLLSVTISARLRGQQAAVDGDRSRYWRELGSAMRMLGETESADNFDAMSTKSTEKPQVNDFCSNGNRV
jgi:hypothetical protein